MNEGQKFTTGQTEDKRPTHPWFICSSITTSVLIICVCHTVYSINRPSPWWTGWCICTFIPPQRSWVQFQSEAFSSQQVGFISSKLRVYKFTGKSISITLFIEAHQPSYSAVNRSNDISMQRCDFYHSHLTTRTAYSLWSTLGGLQLHPEKQKDRRISQKHIQVTFDINILHGEKKKKPFKMNKIFLIVVLFSIKHISPQNC